MSSVLESIPGLKSLLANSIAGGKDPFYNISWFSVPLSLLLAAWPHWYTIYLAESNKIQGGWSNVNPRFWVQSLIAKAANGKKLSPLELQILRGQSCQANSFENVPLFLGTVLWANYTGLERETINNFVLGYLVSRVLYTLLYLKVSGKAESFARTVVFNFGIGWIVTIWIKGGLRISPKA